MPECLHAFLGAHRLIAGNHLDEGVALIGVDNAGLHAAIGRKDLLQLLVVGLATFMSVHV